MKKAILLFALLISGIAFAQGYGEPEFNSECPGYVYLSFGESARSGDYSARFVNLASNRNWTEGHTLAVFDIYYRENKVGQIEVGPGENTVFTNSANNENISVSVCRTPDGYFTLNSFWATVKIERMGGPVPGAAPAQQVISSESAENANAYVVDEVTLPPGGPYPLSKYGSNSSLFIYAMPFGFAISHMSAFVAIVSEYSTLKDGGNYNGYPIKITWKDGGVQEISAIGATESQQAEVIKYTDRFANGNYAEYNYGSRIVFDPPLKPACKGCNPRSIMGIMDNYPIKFLGKDYVIANISSPEVSIVSEKAYSVIKSGEEISDGNISVRFVYISMATGESNIHPGIFDILSNAKPATIPTKISNITVFETENFLYISVAYSSANGTIKGAGCRISGPEESYGRFQDDPVLTFSFEKYFIQNSKKMLRIPPSANFTIKCYGGQLQFLEEASANGSYDLADAHLGQTSQTGQSAPILPSAPEAVPVQQPLPQNHTPNFTEAATGAASPVPANAGQQIPEPPPEISAAQPSFFDSLISFLKSLFGLSG